MELEPVIGLEIHVQLKTKSKMFCTCSNRGDEAPINSCVCEICLGHPGTLPVPNKTAVDWTVKSALALHCKINKVSKFDRKHYFYPDLPKGYQISQYDQPFGEKGYLEMGDKKIRIHRIHLEEDAAKLTHPEGKDYSVVDYNRGGTPLMEIVTEPDMSDPQTAGNFLRELRSIMRAIDVSDADMEKGHLRCDANISLRKKGSKKLYPKTEIKNINSFKNVEKALAYEIKRQRLLWDQETPPDVQSTRGFDAATGQTTPQREKEEANDYRYFPEPDIPPMEIENVESIQKSLPELPQQKRSRFREQYGFSIADAAILTRDYELANYTEQVMSEVLEWAESLDDSEPQGGRLPKLTANWLINDLAPRIENKWDDLDITAENFAEFIALIADGKISSKAGQQILKTMVETKKDPSDIMQEGNLEQVGESDELTEVIEKVIKENEHVVKDYKGGKETALKFLMGQVMRLTQGRANPQIVEQTLKKALS